MTIGFIGLGIMGKPMAKNLCKAGYNLVVADKFAPAAVAEVVACGAKEGKSNMDVGSQADILITMVPNSPNVKEALFGEDAQEGRDCAGLLLDQPDRVPRNLRGA